MLWIVACCLLYAICNMLFVVGCRWSLFVDCWLRFCRSLFVVCFFVCCLLLLIVGWLLADCWLLLFAGVCFSCVLSVVCGCA